MSAVKKKYVTRSITGNEGPQEINLQQCCLGVLRIWVSKVFKTWTVLSVAVYVVNLGVRPVGMGAPLLAFEDTPVKKGVCVCVCV